MQDVAPLRAQLHRNPREVARAAVTMLAARSGSSGDDAGVAELLVVLGRARLALGEIDLAESTLREAVTTATARQDDEQLADASLALAGVLVFAGRPQEAFGCLDTARARGSAAVRALADAQHGVIEQILGHRPQALDRMDAAVAGLRALGDTLQLARVLVNRGTVLTEVGDARAAIADLTAAHATFEAEGQGFVAAQVLHNLGYAHGLAGDLPAALSYLDRAAQAFRAAGHDAPEVEMDRVEVLLAAGLARDAAVRAESLVRLLAAAGDRHKEAVARLSVARAWSAAGDPDRGRSAAADAARLFAELGQRPWQLLAELDALPDPPAAPDVVRVAEGLAACGNARAAARGYGMAAVAAARAGHPDADLVDEVTSRADRLGTPELRMLAALARAEHAAAGGDPVTAARHARTGLDVLAAHRATLGATDARAAAAHHARELVQVGLRLAVRDADALAALGWMEAARSAAAPASGVPADELTRLRALAAELRTREASGEDATDVLAGMRRLEDELRDRSLATAGSAGDRVAALDVDRLRDLLDGGSLVALDVLDGRLVAVRLDARGPARLLDGGPARAAQAAVDAVAGGVRLAGDPGRPPAGRLAGLASVRRGTAALDAALGAALAGAGPLTLVVPPRLQAVPWHLCASLRERPVVAAPSATWCLAASAEGPADRAGGVLAVAGPRLEHARAEARAVAAAHPSSRLLTGDDATAERVLAALGEADVAHLACHARSRTDAPLWSTVELAGGPAFGYDLERVPRLPRLVVLSGCDTATGVPTGDRLLGLPAVLLDRGSRTVLGTLAALPDSAATCTLMVQVHRAVAAGATAAQAVAGLAAAAGDDRDDLDRAAVVAGLACYGTHR